MPPKSPLLIHRLTKDPRVVPILLGLLRVLICFWPQTGYLHPDEFFQSADIVAGRQLGTKIGPVWEFTTDQPIRCMLLPNILNGVAFKIVNAIHSQPSAYLLLVAPRLIYTLASFSIDYCLLLLCQYYSAKGLPYLPVLVIFQSSFICLGIFTRTLSNTTEAILFALLLVLVCRVVRPTFRIVFFTPKLSKPINQRISKSAQITSALLIGSLVTLGTFNRPTFPCFALVPCIYWLHESFKRNSYSMRLTVQRAALPLIISGFMTFGALSCYDTIYYRNYETVRNMFEDLLHMDYEKFYTKFQSNWILTPYNFLVFNTDASSTAKYGNHSRYTHLLVNLPLAFNLLAIIFYRKVLTHTAGSGLHRFFNTHRIQIMMLLSTSVSILSLSMIPHQEFRFLAPLVIPLVYVCASDIYHNKKLLTLWFIINLILIYFYARVHQSGVTNALLDLDLTLKKHQKTSDNSLINVIATKCYPVPTYAWNIDQDDDRFYLNLGDTITDNFYDNINDKLQPILKRLADDINSTSTNQKLFVLLPRLYVDRLLEHLNNQPNLDTTLEKINNYSLHFGGEEFGESIEHLTKRSLLAWREAFGFSLIQIKLSSLIGVTEEGED